jgi:hypothetical protein
MGLARLLAKADADHVWCIAGFALEIATNDHFGFLLIVKLVLYLYIHISHLKPGQFARLLHHKLCGRLHLLALFL